MEYFTSDNHFFHGNIIKYCSRPFRDANHMNEVMVANWNQRVQPDDEVYCLGDFAFGDKEPMQRLFDRLSGRKYLVGGNHDQDARDLDGWEWVRDYHELRGPDHVVLFHYAPRVWNRSHHGSIALYGHSHGRMPGNSQSLDVGVDCWEFTPTSLDQIKRRLATLPKFIGYAEQAGGSDHHGDKATGSNPV